MFSSTKAGSKEGRKTSEATPQRSLRNINQQNALQQLLTQLTFVVDLSSGSCPKHHLFMFEFITTSDRQP
jgi:hypothetical protein